MRSLILLTRSYSHVVWLVHLVTLTSVLTAMVFLHNSTCGLETHGDLSPPGAEARADYSQVHHVRKRHLMSSSHMTIPEDVATSNGTLPDISKNLTVTPDIARFLSRPIINQQDYPFIHNPVDKCKGKDLKFIVIIPSARYNFDQRRKVRMSTLKNFMRDHPDDGVMLFFLGVPPKELQADSARYQKKIDKEADDHQDIVQEDYMDTHRTLKTKSVAMLKWVNQFCNNAKYVIKLDDDVRFDTSEFLDIVSRAMGGKENAILGQVNNIRSKVSRNPSSRYFVSETEYPEARFPPYVMGGLLAYPMSTARLLYEGSLRVKSIPLDDIYMTGLVAREVNVSLVYDSDFTFQHHSCGAIRL